MYVIEKMFYIVLFAERITLETHIKKYTAKKTT